MWINRPVENKLPPSECHRRSPSTSMNPTRPAPEMQLTESESRTELMTLGPRSSSSAKKGTSALESFSYVVNNVQFCQVFTF